MTSRKWSAKPLFNPEIQHDPSTVLSRFVDAWVDYWKLPRQQIINMLRREADRVENWRDTS